MEGVIELPQRRLPPRMAAGATRQIRLPRTDFSHRGMDAAIEHVEVIASAPGKRKAQGG